VRAVSLSNPKIISLLNSKFVPVFASNEDYQDNGSASADEKAALRRIFAEGYAKKLSVGTVHAYVVGPDGHLVDSMHTVGVSKPAELLPMLEKATEQLGTKPGAPIVKPQPVAAPNCAPGGLQLYLVARYLEKKGDDYALIQDAGGNWSALPSEDWITLEKDDWLALLAKKGAKPGSSWDLPESLATKLFVHFYPPTENWDVSTNRVQSQSLRATFVSRSGNMALIKLDGALKMSHHFSHKEDGRWVEASVVGFAEVDTAAGRVTSLNLVTDHADYFNADGKSALPFGVAVKSTN
jgi:hypothetical protein